MDDPGSTRNQSIQRREVLRSPWAASLRRVSEVSRCSLSNSCIRSDTLAPRRCRLPVSGNRLPENNSLVPRPRVNLTRYHGVLAPNHRWRGAITPARRGKGAPAMKDADHAPRHAAMSWAQRLKRVFNIDIETCARCGGPVKIIACIEDQDVIDRILAHLRAKEASAPARPLLVPPQRAPPDVERSADTDLSLI